MGPADTTPRPPRCHHAPMQITFLGGATTVTGSQYLLVTERAKVLIDCGMFQGSPNESIRNRLPFAFHPADLDAVLLTHAHLDHCGLLPLLVKGGLHAVAIHATAGTIELATLVLLDSGKLHEEFAKREARWEKRHPDEVEADDRREADEYQAAVDLAAAGESGTGAVGATSATSTARPPPTSPPRRPATRKPSTSPRRSKPSTSPATRRPPGHAIPRPSCAPSRRTSRSTLTRRCTRPRTPRAPWRSSRPSHYGEEVEVAPGIHATFVDAGHILGSAIIRLARPGDRGWRGAVDRLLRRPRPAGHADPARPDGHDRRRLRPRRVDLRRPRARTRGRGDPHPRRDGPDGRRRRRRAARPVVRDRADAGGRLGARPAHRARRDPAAAALSRLADGLEGVRHLPPPPRLLRRGDGQAAARGRDAARLPEPDRHQRRRRPRRRSSSRRGRT